MTTLNTYHQQVEQLLKDTFPPLQTVESYRIGQTLDTPAVLIEVESMRVGERNGEGKVPVVMAVALHCVLGHGTPNLELEVRNFAAQVMALLQDQYFGMPNDLDRPENIDAQSGEFKPGKGGFETMVVTFQQTIYIGEPVFDLTGPISIKVNFAIDGETEQEVVLTDA